MNRSNNRLYIEVESRTFYSKFKKYCSGLRLLNSEIFSLALALGYQSNIRKPLKRKVGFIRYETISQELYSLMILIAIDEFGDDYSWINNPLDMFDIAEEYANAGIRILMDLISDFDNDFDSFLIENILSAYEQIDFQSNFKHFQME